MGSSTTTLWTSLFPIAGYLVSFSFLLCFKEIVVVDANSVDSDQTPRSAMSDDGSGSALFASNTFGGLQTKTGQSCISQSCNFAITVHL